MGKAIVKGLWGSFRKPKFVAVVVIFSVVICIRNHIACRDYPGENGRILLLSTTTRADTGGHFAFSESKSDAKFEQNDGIPNANKDAVGDHEEWQTVWMRVTAYCPCPKCCGKSADGQTACGYKIRPGDTFVAADKKYQFGTEVIVPGYNNEEPVAVLDRGGAIRGNRLDVFFDSHQQAREWGVKYLEVKVYRRQQS